MGLRAAALACLLAGPLGAEPIRIATWDPGLTRQGPGLLLRDIRARDPQVLAAAQVIVAARPDVILLTGIDWDADGRALAAFSALMADAGLDFPHRFSARPNSGLPTGLDLDGDGRLAEADDAQGWGQFTGQNGMAVLSRLPLGPVTDYSDRLWRDLPGNLMPAVGPEVAQVQRLSSTAHWDLPVMTARGPLRLLAWAATPPVFDGPEDRNGRRNHDEAAFWLHNLPHAPFALIGNVNLDPTDGEGRPEALQRLLDHATDPMPRGAWQPPQTGANATHAADPALDTGDFDEAGPGDLRVDYILPARALGIAGSGVLSPPPDNPLAEAVARASDHRLVWVDLVMPDPPPPLAGAALR
ncbi:endonuclease/exonuclease/phosphatase family protein [Paracoccus spongiarum]|uniref:Endonuclease/exonuclease/phosphatase family protein n=1 Tax=Paracoccus spongiarum TaxID=3064387 RepID=A0ABT9JFM8_9RHOB|nr:endonuclease/exonuclease/phosphatase family protein [Paracoccus sp. 2205BS29-5]MDP5308564.1 endonuclease/exonuclease/phosphatase family protein [Paracoccus sp. 2205BS29-5]